MKNEIQLKEELLVLEAEYNDIFNNCDNNRCKYWYQKSNHYKARELASTMSKCKADLETLKRAKIMKREIETMKIMRERMYESMQNAEILPVDYQNRIQKLDSSINFLEESFNTLYTVN